MLNLDFLNKDADSLHNVKSNSSDGQSENVITETINNNLYFYAHIDTESILSLNKELLKLKNTFLFQAQVTSHSITPLYLYVQSNGGSLLSGLSAMDTILKIREQIPIYTVVDGYVASAASFLTIVGTKRYIKKNSFVMIHQLSSFASGNYEQIKDSKYSLDKLMKTMKSVYKEYTKLPMKKLDEILKRDLLLTSDEAIEYGIADEIL